MTHDPYDPPSTRTFECLECGERVEADHQPVECEECGGELQDISVPREQ